MACHLFSTKPLSDPILAYYQLDHWEQISVNHLNQNTMIFVQENDFIKSHQHRPHCLHVIFRCQLKPQ